MIDENKASNIFYKYARRPAIHRMDEEDFFKALKEYNESVQIPHKEIPKTVLMVSVNKTSKIDGKIFNEHCHHISYSRDRLRKYLLDFYNIKNLIKDVGDEFPYFTDGGFKYTAENENWKYEFVCFPYTIIE